MRDHKELDRYIESLEATLLFLRECRNRAYEDGQAGDYLRELQHLKDLLRSGAWPPAVPADLVCRSGEDKSDRAQTVVAGLVPLAGLTFLDYGCGEGHVARLAAESAARAVGYDRTAQDWGPLARQNLYFTTDWVDVAAHGPYDVILLDDVLDHCDDPEAVLGEITKVRQGNGPVYVRCHPWTSRHATHLYHALNKAFLHLVFSEEELLKLGYSGRRAAKHVPCREAYRDWFARAGLEVKAEMPRRRPVEEFFARDPALRRRLKPYPAEECALEWVDYVLA